MKKILITGGLGFIGTALAKALIDKKFTNKCILVDNFGGYVNPSLNNYYDYRKKRIESLPKNKFIIERLNTKNFKALLNVFLKYSPDIVYHTAALPLAKISNVNADEAKEGSVDSTINLIDALNKIRKKKAKDPRFIYVSSSMVYGDFKKKTVLESEIKSPKEAYGIMKYAGEIITKGMCKLNNLPYTIIRPSAVYGPMDMNRRVTQIFIEAAINNKKIKVEGPNEKLDFTYIDDLVNGLILAGIKKGAINETFNITYGKGRKLIEFVNILKKFYPNLKVQIKPKDKLKPSRGTLSIKKAKKFLGYKPEVNIETGIKNYLNYLKNI